MRCFEFFRGDLTRERKNKIKILKDGNTAITGLAIRSTGKQNYLFVATTLSVYLYNITVKDKETRSPLDNMGCAAKCSVLAETIQDSHFMIGRNNVRFRSAYGPGQKKKSTYDSFKRFFINMIYQVHSANKKNVLVKCKIGIKNEIFYGNEKSATFANKFFHRYFFLGSCLTIIIVQDNND